MPPAEASDLRALRAKLAGMRAEFVDLAFALERRGRIDAADVAMTAPARVGELCDEFADAQSADEATDA